MNKLKSQVKSSKSTTPSSVVENDTQEYTDFAKRFNDPGRVGTLDSMGQVVERALVERYKKGDKGALKKLVQRRKGRLAARVEKLSTPKPVPESFQLNQTGIPLESGGGGITMQQGERKKVEAQFYADQMSKEDYAEQAGKDYEGIIGAFSTGISGFSGFKGLPGSGLVLDGFLRGVVNTGNATVGKAGIVLQDVDSVLSAAVTAPPVDDFGQPLDIPQMQGDPVEALTELGTYMSTLSQDVAVGIQAYENRRPKGSKHWSERVAEAGGGLVASLPQLMLGVKTLGPAGYFGLDRMYSARANGEQDPTKLTAEFAQGVAEGALLNQLGKTTEWIDKLKGRGVVTQALKSSPKTAQVVAQGVGGVGQVKMDSMLHSDQAPPDWLDYLIGGGTNMVLDPVLFGRGVKSGKATQLALKGKDKFQGANLELPELGEVRKEFWQPEELPIENLTVSKLLGGARVEFHEDSGVLYVNPQAGVLIGRAYLSLDGKTKEINKANGTVFTPETSMALAEVFERKANEVKQVIDSVEDPSRVSAEVNEMLEAGVRYEALAEHFDALANRGENTVVRFGNAKGPRPKEFDQTVVGHEYFHGNVQMKVAEAVGTSAYSIQEPGFLLEHPLGAKLMSNMDAPGNPLRLYEDPRTWTSEAMAYVAEPGDSPIGLTKVERGVLLGDYFSHLASVHGSAVMRAVDAKWIDREVAMVAFKRMAEANLVKLNRDYAGKPIGLIWQDIPRVAEFEYEGVRFSPPVRNETENEMFVQTPFVPQDIPVNPDQIPYDPNITIDDDGLITGDELEELFNLVTKKETTVNIPALNNELAMDRLAQQDNLGFYAKSEQVVKDKMRGPMTGQQLMSVLTNAGVRVGELEWRGLTGWLKENANVKLSKEQVAEFLDQSRFAVQENREASDLYSGFVSNKPINNYREFIFTTDVMHPETGEGIGFSGGHFYENTLAHVRTTDRVDVESGKKYLRIEEVQSDLHQEGKKKGYRTPEKPFELDISNYKAIDATSKIGSGWWHIVKIGAPEGSFVESVFAQSEKEALNWFASTSKKNARMDHERDNLTKPTPAPFERTWAELAVKRMVKVAIEEGYDAIEFITGKEADSIVGGKNEWWYDRDLPNKLKAAGLPVKLADDTVKRQDTETKIKVLTLRVKEAQSLLADADERLTRAKANTHTSRDFINSLTDSIEYAYKNLRRYETDLEEAQSSLDNNSQRHTIELTPEFIHKFTNKQHFVPFHLDPEPLDVDSVDAAEAVVDEFVKEGSIVFDRTTATPEAIQKYNEVHGEYSEVLRTERKALASLKMTKVAYEYAKSLAEVGLDMSQQLAVMEGDMKVWQAQLKQAREAKPDKALAVRDFLNTVTEQVKGNREGLLKETVEGVDKATQDAIAKAKLDIESGVEGLKKETPEYQVALGQITFERIAKLGRDVLIANNIPVVDSAERSLHRQMFDAIQEGKLDIEAVDRSLEQYDTSFGQLMQDFLDAGTVFGKGLNALSQQKKFLNRLSNAASAKVQASLQKLFKDYPEVDAWYKNSVPTVGEMRKLIRGRTNAARFLSIGEASMLLTQATQAVNAVQSTAVIGHKSLVGVVESLLQRIHTGNYDVMMPDGTLESRKMQPMSIVENFRPLVEVVNVAKYAAGRVAHGDFKWLDTGDRGVGRPNEAFPRALKLLENVMEVPEFAQVKYKMIGALDADLEAMDLDAANNAIKVIAKQVDMMPLGERRTRLQKELRETQKKYYKESGKLSRGLRAVEAGMHKAMIIGRGPERVLRSAVFSGALQKYSRMYGQDAYALSEAGRVAELRPEAVARAMYDALESTFGLQPDGRNGGSTERRVADYLKWLRDADTVAAIGLRGMMPFQSFIGQYSKFVIENNPTGWGRYLRLATQEGRDSIWNADGNYDKLSKAILGTTAFTFAYLATKHKYDEVERKKRPADHPEWDSLADTGVSLKGTIWGPMFFVADQIERQRRGLKSNTNSVVDWAAGLGPDFRGVAGYSDLVDKLYTDIFDGQGGLKEKTAEAFGLAVGKWWNRHLTPIRNYTDIAGEFDQHQRTMKELRGWSWGTVATPFMDRAPQGIGVREMLEDKIDLFTGRPQEKFHPGSRAFTGFTLLPVKSYPERVFTTAGIKYGDWVPFSGIPEVDRELSKEVAARAGKVTAAMENSMITTLPMDKQIARLYELYREVALEAKVEVMGRFPEVEAQMEYNKELNFWERRVQAAVREANGLKPVEELWKEMKAAREARKAQQKK